MNKEDYAKISINLTGIFIPFFLMKLINQNFSSAFGKKTCKSILDNRDDVPDCHDCPVNNVCPSSLIENEF